MQKLLSGVICFAVIFTCLISPGIAPAAEVPAVGGVLPDIRLSPPSDGSEREYLDVSRFGTFKITEIKTQVLVVEIFSMYCPHCQKEAPKVNELYRKIEGNPDLKGRIKLIGLGAGNTQFEVDLFKKKYKIPFPLFADPDFKIYEMLGQLRTPYFVGVNLHMDGSHKIFYSKLGAFESVEGFWESMIRLSGLK